MNKRDRLTLSMLLLILALVIGIGAGTLVGVSALPQSTSDAFALPPGPQFTITLTYSLFSGGSLEVSYQVAGNASVDVFLFNQTTYTAYLHGEFPGDLNDSAGTAGNASASLPSGGNYYVVLTHDPASLFTSVAGTFAVRVTGIDATRALEGSVAAVFAVGAAAFGVYERRLARPGVLRGLNDRPR